MSGTHSGKFARLGGVSTVRNWTIDDSVTLARGYASNTRWGPVRNGGVRNWTGQFEYFGKQPPAMPGDLVAILAYGAPNNDVSGTGQLYDGDIMIDQIVQNWSWRDGMMLSGSTNFGGHLVLDHPEGADPFDPTDPVMEPVCGLIIEGQWGSGDYVEIEDLTQATLTISAQNPTYVNSSSHIGGFCWTGRKAGPIDATLSLTQENDVRVNGYFDVGDNIAIKAWVSETEFWEILWFRVGGFTGIRADRETGAIIQRTIQLELNIWDGSGHGAITLPDLTEWWPVSVES